MDKIQKQRRIWRVDLNIILKKKMQRDILAKDLKNLIIQNKII
jgi:hypothetical protein